MSKRKSSKNYDQSQKAKKEFQRTSALAAYMLGDANRVFTKEELMEVMGNISDRAIREKLAEVANYYPIVATSDKKGYRLICFSDRDTPETLQALYDDCQHQLNELQCRIDNLKARMKPLRAMQEVILKTLMNSESNVEDCILK